MKMMKVMGKAMMKPLLTILASTLKYSKNTKTVNISLKILAFTLKYSKNTKTVKLSLKILASTLNYSENTKTVKNIFKNIGVHHPRPFSPLHLLLQRVDLLTIVDLLRNSNFDILKSLH